MAWTEFVDGTTAVASEVNANFDMLMQVAADFAGVGVGNTVITVDDAECEVAFGQKYIKANQNYESFGSDLVTAWSGQSHSHPATTSSRSGSGFMSNYLGGTTVIPKYLMTGSKIIIISDSNWEIPKGGILFSMQSFDKYTSISGKYFFIGESSDGGSSTHNHTSGNYGSYGGGSNGTPTASNELNDRMEVYSIYNNSGTYNSSNDIIPVGGCILQKVGESVPANYSEVGLSGKSGLLRFCKETSDILVEGGTTTHTHSDLNNSSSGSYSAYFEPVSSEDHMPSYLAVRMIKRSS